MKKSLVILIVAAAVVWGLWYWQSSSERQSLAVPEMAEFFVVDSTQVDSVAIKFSEWTFIGRGSGEWLVHQYGRGKKASVNLLSNVIRTTNGMVLGDLITSKRAKFAQFKVDTLDGNIIRFFQAGQPLAEFVLGKISSDFGSTYIRELDSDSVYHAYGQFQSVFQRVPSSWRDNTIWNLDAASIDTVIWESTDETVTLFRDAETVAGWSVSAQRSGKTRAADSLQARFKLDKVARITANDFPQPFNPEIPAFDKIDMELTVVTNDGGRHKLWFQKDDHPNITRYFAYLEGEREDVMLFFGHVFDDFNADFDQLAAPSGESSS